MGVLVHAPASRELRGIDRPITAAGRPSHEATQLGDASVSIRGGTSCRDPVARYPRLTSLTNTDCSQRANSMLPGRLSVLRRLAQPREPSPVFRFGGGAVLSHPTDDAKRLAIAETLRTSDGVTGE